MSLLLLLLLLLLLSLLFDFKGHSGTLNVNWNSTFKDGDGHAEGHTPSDLLRAKAPPRAKKDSCPPSTFHNVLPPPCMGTPTSSTTMMCRPPRKRPRLLWPSLFSRSPTALRASSSSRSQTALPTSEDLALCPEDEGEHYPTRIPRTPMEDEDPSDTFGNHFLRHLHQWLQYLRLHQRPQSRL